MDGRFPKGHKPWNKGKKGIHLSPSSEFKEGVLAMEKHHCWKGGVHHIKNDCAYVMVESNKRVRRPRLVYEEAFGPVPAGCVIYHKDGNKDNDDQNNLEAISRADLIKINNRRRRGG